MRRPLLFVSFCLVALIALVYFGQPVSKEAGPPDGTHIRAAGWVCEKDENSFTIKFQDLSILSEAAVLQQDNSNQDNFINNVFDGISRCNKLLVSYDGAQELILGSEVTLEGELYAFSAATNPGEFDYAGYYHSMGYLGRMRDVQILGQSGDAGLQEWLYRLRCYWKRRIYTVFPQREASVMAAILLGEKSDVDEEIRALYQRNGIVHILSISGLHITIIGMGIYKLLRRIGLPVWVAAVLGATVLVLYGMMTGFGVSVCRAIGMYLLRMLGLLWRRTYDMLTALGVVGAGMALFRPAWLGHMGFLLSFGSVLGLGLMVPALVRHRDEEECGKPKRYVEGKVKQVLQQVWKFLCDLLREGLLAGIVITLTTLPIQLWFSYEISVYAVLLNALILPLMSAVMVAGLVAMLVPGLGIVGTVDVMILTGYEGLCHVFEALPAAMWNPGRPAVWQVVVYYLLWAVVVWVLPWIGRRLRQKRKVQKFMVGHPGKWQFHVSLFRVRRFAQVFLLALAVGILAVPRFCGDRVTFLDVGQGDCICVQLASGEVYLFDCGSSSRKGVSEDVLIPFLKYYGISEIDAVFASHGDADHINGLVELFDLRKENHITIRQFVLPSIEQATLQEEFGELLAAIGNADADDEIPVSVIWAGEGWTVDDEDRFLCLHPSDSRVSQGGNEGSQCFYVELHEGENALSLLLTGDVESTGEKELTAELEQRGIGNVDVLKVAHHGSRYSTTDTFLEVVTPSVAVISCGRRNSYGHPHEETLERLEAAECEVLTTPQYGAITVEVDKGVVIRSFCEEVN